MATANLEAYRRARHRFFAWRFEQPWVTKVLLALGFAAITGAFARFEFYLPWTTVPVTLQTFWVLLGAVILGRHYGALSPAFYAGIGAAGAPWFAGGVAGAGILLGHTGGYIVGFVPAAALVAYLTDTWVDARKPWLLVPIMFLGSLIILTIGTAQLALVLGLGFREAMVAGFLTFLPVEFVKAVAVAGIASAVTPKTPFGPELRA